MITSNAMVFNHVYIFYDKVTLLNTATDTCIKSDTVVLQHPKLLIQTAYSQVLNQGTNRMIAFGFILILVP